MITVKVENLKDGMMTSHGIVCFRWGGLEHKDGIIRVPHVVDSSVVPVQVMFAFYMPGELVLVKKST